MECKNGKVEIPEILNTQLRETKQIYIVVEFGVSYVPFNLKAFTTKEDAIAFQDTLTGKRALIETIPLDCGKKE